MKKVYLLLCFLFVHSISYSFSLLGGPGVAATASTFCVPATNQIIGEFTIRQNFGSTTLTSVQFSSAGTYVSADITNYQLWIGTSASFAAASLLPASTYTTAPLGPPGPFTLNAGGATLTNGTTYYVWITATLPNTAVTGHTITTTITGITVASGGSGGSTSTQGTQTINNVPTGVTASVAPNPVCAGSNITLTGTATNATSYAWAGPSGFSSGLLNPASFAATIADAGIYTLTATNICGSTTVNSASLVVNALPAAISGPSVICLGTTATMTDASTPGTWSSTAVGVAPITAGGVVTGSTAGTSNIIFTETATGCQVTLPVTVSVSLPSITGLLNLCQYTASTISDAIAGGTWSLSNTTLASIGSASGVLVGLEGGLDTITYTYSACTITAVATVNPIPDPGVISGVTTICIGGTTVLTDTPAGGAWVSGNPLIATIDAGGTVTGLAWGSAMMTYNLTNSCGTAGAVVMINVERSVSSINGLYSLICIDNGLGLSDSVSGGLWSSSNVNATVDSFSGLVIGAAVGVDTIMYTLTNACGTTVADYTVSVGLGTPPGMVSGSTIVCVGSAITMSETVTGGYWSTTFGHASVDSTGLVIGVTQGMDSVKYNLMALCGPTFAYKVIQVDSFGTPFVTVTQSPGPSSCETIPVTFTANPLFGGTSPGYIWRVNGAFVDSSSAYTFVPSNTDTITCNMTSNYTCVTSPTASNFVIANVLPKVIPDVSVTAATYGDTVCIGTLVSYLAHTHNGGTTPGFQWTVNGISIAPGPIDSIMTYTPNNGDVITCKLLSNAVCPLPDSALASVSMTVMTTETPTISIAAHPSDSVCAGTLVTYSANYDFGGITPHFVWLKNGVPVAYGSTYSYNSSNLDTIVCEYTSSETCATPANVTSNKIIMHTSGVTPVDVSLSANPGLAVPYGHNDTLVATIGSGAGPHPTYQWIVNSVVVLGATSNTFVLNYVAGVNYVSCVVKGSGDCPASEAIVTDTVYAMANGVKVLSGSINQLILAPNPNNGDFNLIGSVANATDYIVEVTDIVGNVIYRKSAIATSGIINQQVHLPENLQSGIYLLRVTCEGASHVIRFDVNR